MYIRSLKWALVLSLMICVGSSLPAWAQSTSTGTVAGSVTDPSGAVVAGASVTLTDTATNIARPTTTNATGRYIYVDVNPGIYAITVNTAGFETTKTENQEVKVGASLTVNLALQVGGANVVVEVSAVGNELERPGFGYARRYRMSVAVAIDEYSFDRRYVVQHHLPDAFVFGFSAPALTRNILED